VQVYQNCFPPSMTSACVSWAKRHVDDFNVILMRQLSSVDASSQEWQDCMDQARAHAAMLSVVGMDFRNSIGFEGEGGME
jgi:exocyst complex component 8